MYYKELINHFCFIWQGQERNGQKAESEESSNSKFLN